MSNSETNPDGFKTKTPVEQGKYLVKLAKEYLKDAKEDYEKKKRIEKELKNKPRDYSKLGDYDFAKLARIKAGHRVKKLEEALEECEQFYTDALGMNVSIKILSLLQRQSPIRQGSGSRQRTSNTTRKRSNRRTINPRRRRNTRRN